MERFTDWLMNSIIGILAALVLGIAIKWVWNYLMPDLFGFVEITYWQGVAMFVLSNMLFNGT